ncbi:hypothetical protein RHMOL_Rhmol01G0081700 [Rhododendron molle]|uniref:Uncharacterized protein n=1 Tax=Rhododendron molle TaxID=49168 RepID=A0ACC0Q2I0_RHOML|nr:hypothetical protein RHMOL_Rhmol01G0081700 [Rhododendron molle]
MQITFEDEFLEAEKNSPLAQQQSRRFYEKMRRVAVAVHIGKANRELHGNKFQRLQGSGIGSGFIITKDGHIMTCLHNVLPARIKKRRIFIARAEEPDVFREAVEEGHDEPGSDVAVLKLKEVDQEFDYCKFGSIDDVSIGKQAFSISNPLGFEFSFLMGQVSFPCVVHGDIKMKKTNSARSYDAELPLVQFNNLHTRPGSSGGPVFDGKGRIIAMSCFGLGDIDYDSQDSEDESGPDVEHVFSDLNSFDAASGQGSWNVPVKKKPANASHNQQKKPQRDKDLSWRVQGDDSGSQAGSPGRPFGLQMSNLFLDVRYALDLSRVLALSLDLMFSGQKVGGHVYNFALHYNIYFVIHIIFLFQTGFMSPSSLVFGRGVLVEDAWASAKRSYFLIDILAVLPLPQWYHWPDCTVLDGLINSKRDKLKIVVVTSHVVGGKLEKVISRFNISKGVLVEEVIKGSPAEQAGIFRGDIIVQCGKKSVHGVLEVPNLFHCCSELQARNVFFDVIWENVGKSLELAVVRESSATHLNLKLFVDETSPDKVNRFLMLFIWQCVLLSSTSISNGQLNPTARPPSPSPSPSPSPQVLGIQGPKRKGRQAHYKYEMEYRAALFDHMRDLIVVLSSKPSEEDEEMAEAEAEAEAGEGEGAGAGEGEGEDEDEDEEEAEEEEEKEVEEGGGNQFGAGMVINERGYILTCAHLVPQGNNVTVYYTGDAGGREAEEFLRDEECDLVILRTKGVSVGCRKFCEFGGTEALHMGMALFTISHPHGIVYSFLTGNVAYPERMRQQIPFYYRSSVPDEGSFFQINNMHGTVRTSHGAPVFDSSGKVYGLITFTKGFDFAVCPETLKKFVKSCSEKLKAEGEKGKGKGKGKVRF